MKAVLLRRPGQEVENIIDPHKWRWGDTVNPDKMRQQHDQVAEIYRKNGVKVYYVKKQRRDKANSIFMRDNVLGTPEGAIVCRQALDVRRGEEKAVAKSLAEIGVPIVRTISGNGIFEGACGLWVDRKTIILGTGVRSNKEGVKQVKEVLKGMGVENILDYQIPYGHAHLDGLINFVDKKKALIFPWQVPYDIVAFLLENDFEIIEAPSIEEVKKGMAVNLVALEPGKVLMPAGNPKTKEVLNKNEIKVLEVDVSEIMKAYGSLHCMTAFLKREEI